MSYKVNRSTSYTITTTEGDFTVEFEPVDNSEVVKVSEDKKRAVIAYLSRDENPSDPRKEQDNVGTMACWHSRYNLGDEQHTESGREFFRDLAVKADPKLDDKIERYELHHRSQDSTRVNEWITKTIESNYVMLPLYLYDHSGITMSTGSFIGRAQHAEWDSGMVGWIYATKQKVLEEWGNGSRIITPEIREKAEAYLKGEVETYDQYLTGDVYGVCAQLFTNVADEGDEPEWEAWSESGTIGYNGGGSPITGDLGRDECWGYYGYDYAKEEVKSLADNYEDWLSTPLPDPEALTAGTGI